MKRLLVTLSTLLLGIKVINIPAAKADTYIETKSNTGFINKDYQGELIQTRFGYDKHKGDTDFYIEIGPGYLSAPDQSSPTFAGEIGITFPIVKHVTGHVKYEGIYQFNQQQLNSDFETSIRYTF